MRILSKYKDYYDYLKGIYGEDPKLVLDRRSPNVNYFVDGPFTLLILGRLIMGFVEGGEAYVRDDLLKIGFIKETTEHWKYGYEYDLYERTVSDWPNRDKRESVSCDSRDFKPSIDSDCPIVLLTESSSKVEWPRLDQYKVGRFITPHEMWVGLTAWLSKKLTDAEPSVPIGDDNVRIQSHGFDLKTSFRPKMK